MRVNVRSLVNPSNFFKFEGLTSSLSFKSDIICMTEISIQSFTSGKYRNLSGYKFVSNCTKIMQRRSRHVGKKLH